MAAFSAADAADAADTAAEVIISAVAVVVAPGILVEGVVVAAVAAISASSTNLSEHLYKLVFLARPRHTSCA